ncbi:macrolide transport system ATP-binding/permease protein [Rhodobium orientis]|uniref:Pyoverdine export ATP-binding/permease protein PvdT n=1 Tax=Rhodobium orientis TaxID=34017 RepID=A0A327JIT0_9HYPH|nr:MacB family efflux pump subunit [Rhodobium orientis]MBB4305244.1 macrolide transport system ATP-binding/permease protein [Rhodobium orientis]MBK5952128.1 macrolide ABC transporter permease/ATP-binding protein MacB [Rhodobium orientis]RAI26320.1 macrolide ABC transporter permease/ATP-binding protein MacB [Rhodobium orientis]
MTADTKPLIEVKGLTRAFRAGEDELLALDHIDLTIERGEMVAIVGASGSGKSTLMNILGCLDRPTGGSYRINGRETAERDADELAALRREHFGFIFQRYHLLAELTAVGNVEIPAIYAGRGGEERHERAVALLSRLGMDDRLGHRPGQLSGGQQQRVSIARALMNGAEVILADEPTGALDSQSGEEVLKILQELNADGKTVIMVTHDPAIAAHANRTIELKDGVIVADTRTDSAGTVACAGRDEGEKLNAGARSLRAEAARFREAFRMAVVAMRAHKVRAFLTMLGIIIGIASVVAVVALGEGSRQKVLANISSLGTNTLEVFPGRDFGDVRSGRITTLVVADANALARQPYVAAVTPTVTTSDTIRFGAEEASGRINGVSDAYFAAEGLKLASGRLFDADSVARRSQDAVIDQNTQSALFKDGVDPVGKVVFVGPVPCRVIGVVEPRSGGFGSSNNPSVYLPYTTVQTRILGDTRLRSITVQVSDDTDTDLAEKAVTKFLTSRHGTKDFFILNTDDIRRTITSTTETLTLLIAAIALISLFVGGIGVMNIMLVSVSERVGEIGVRMAVGARRGDILRQFLIEAVLVCLIGGVLGIAAALGFGALFKLVGSNFTLIYSTTSIVAAFLCSSLIGVAFGYLPARNASRLDPVVALMRD